MNKTKIEWCDYTWNVVTGCLHNCPYCYARRIDKRFGDGSFTPTFHRERLDEPLKVKKPSRIFVGSMADLFGDWDWAVGSWKFSTSDVMADIFEIIDQCPQHTFIFLTKNPKGMQGFDFPANCWCGTSVENQEKADERLPELLKVNCKTLSVSYEPALGPVDLEEYLLPICKQCNGDMSIPSPFGGGRPCPRCINDQGRDPKSINWLIIGAQTGPGAEKPKMDWFLVAEQAQAANIPVFIKDNAADYYGGELLPREYPGVTP